MYLDGVPVDRYRIPPGLEGFLPAMSALMTSAGRLLSDPESMNAELDRLSRMPVRASALSDAVAGLLDVVKEVRVLMTAMKRDPRMQSVPLGAILTSPLPSYGAAGGNALTGGPSGAALSGPPA
jgi:hypothetical protein